jgi:F0F1-type ATP synthase assembly protein I
MMSPFEPSPGPKKRGEYAQIALLGSVLWILIGAPAVGFFAGQWADKKFGSTPWLTAIGSLLGFAAAAREIYNIVRRAEAMDKQDKDK